MPVIPVVKKPHPDELLYSWILRLADANGFSAVSFCGTYAGVQINKRLGVPLDFRKGFPELWENLRLGAGLRETYLALTTFGFESMAMTPWAQAKYLDNVFQKDSALNVKTGPLLKRARICPVCAGEDIEKYGAPYLRRSHQLSGVMTCHKHGCMLYEYCGSETRGQEFCSGDYKEIRADIPEDSLRACTDYAQKLFESGINTDVFQIKKTLSGRICPPGRARQEAYSAFFRGLAAWEHACLCGKKQEEFVRAKGRFTQRIDMSVLVPLLMYLFPDVSELKSTLGDHAPVPLEYICPDCGQIYCLAPAAAASGWECPACSREVPDQERFERLIRKNAGPAYEVLSEFTYLNKPVLFRHKTCGRTIKLRPMDMLCSGTGCPCERPLWDRFRGITEFEYVEADSTCTFVTMRHRKCGRTFQCTCADFLADRTCRACFPTTVRTDNLGEYVRELTGDEYFLIRLVYDAEPSAVIRHSACGYEEIYGVKDFLGGRRCRKCSRVPVGTYAKSLPKMRIRCPGMGVAGSKPERKDAAAESAGIPQAS